MRHDQTALRKQVNAVSGSFYTFTQVRYYFAGLFTYAFGEPGCRLKRSENC